MLVQQVAMLPADVVHQDLQVPHTDKLQHLQCHADEEVPAQGRGLKALLEITQERGKEPAFGEVAVVCLVLGAHNGTQKSHGSQLKEALRGGHQPHGLLRKAVTHHIDLRPEAVMRDREGQQLADELLPEARRRPYGLPGVCAERRHELVQRAAVVEDVQTAVALPVLQGRGVHHGLEHLRGLPLDPLVLLCEHHADERAQQCPPLCTAVSCEEAPEVRWVVQGREQQDLDSQVAGLQRPGLTLRGVLAKKWH
mmetsp:Transcript_91906/g.284227  ORF Transcript_91906/g.284227 Transcript_91906/m.284227 type:complete len:253 (+) Transcript_91906:1051-1809(+)